MTVRRRATRFISRLDDHRLALGLLVFACAAVAAVIAFKATTGPPFQSAYRIKIALPEDAPIVRKGLAVRVGGKLAGLVSAVEPASQAGGRTITASITKARFRPLPTDSTAFVRVSSLLFNTYIELRPGRADDNLADGDQLPATAASGVDLLEVVRLFDSSTRAALQTTLKTSGVGSAGRGRGLNEALAALPSLSRNAAAQLRAATRDRGALERIVAGAANTAEGLRGRRPDDVSGLLGSTDTVLATVAGRHEELGTALQLLPRFEDELAKTAPLAVPLLDDVAASAHDLVPAVRSLNDQLPGIKRLFALGDVLRAEFGRIAGAADPVLRTAAPVLYDLFPMVTAFVPLERGQGLIDAAIGPYADELHAVGARTKDVLTSSAGGLAPGKPALRATVSLVPRRCYDPLPEPGEAAKQRCPR